MLLLFPICSGALYNLALASSSGSALQRLSTLGRMYFNSQNVATQVAFNLTAWFIFLVGRLALNLLFDGADAMLQGIASLAPAKVMSFLFAPKGAA